MEVSKIGLMFDRLSFVRAGFATPDGGFVDCPICREVFGDEEVGGMAAMDGPARYALMDCCEHPFHVGCLEHWSTQRENSCPSCRATIHYVAEYSLSRPEDSSRMDWRLMIEQVIQVQEAKQADTLDEEEDGFPSSEESDASTYRCVICGDSIIQAAPADQRGVMLLCDAELPRKRTRKGPSKVVTCDAPFHPFCAGYPNVPDGEVFCPQHSSQIPPPVVEESISSTVSSPAVSSSSAEPSESLPSDVKSKEIVELGTSSEEDEEEVKETPKEKSRKKSM
ncbi:PHD and RING finger domain-containing protein 1, partial [Perkinsus olseni]